MPDPFVGEIRMFAGNFAPVGWAFCDGQLLPVSQNAALFSLLGTTYGGDGRTTFALPDLRGRAPIHAGQGPGLSQRNLGAKGGEESVTLAEAQLPSTTGTTRAAVTSIEPRPSIVGSVTMEKPPVAAGGQPHNNMQPYLAVHFIIALVGVYPSRS
jgi:microcystin-dependent protein